DFTLSTLPYEEHTLSIGYYSTLIDSEILHRDIFPFLKDLDAISSLPTLLPIEEIILTTDISVVRDNLLKGYTLIFDVNNLNLFGLVKSDVDKTRQVSLPEVEFSVVGPKESFVESL